MTSRFPLDSLTLRHLRAFKAAADRLNFTAASRILHLTPSAVAQQVRRLELQLGVRLFERGAQLLSLTRHGLLLREHVDTLLLRMGWITQHLHSDPRQVFVELCAPPLFAAELLIPRLPGMVSSHPRVYLRIRTPTDRLGSLPPDADLSILVAREPPPGASAQLLLPSSFVPVCSPEYARQHGVFSDSDLANQVLLAHRYRPDLWQEWSAANGLPALKPRAIIQFDSLVDAVGAARTGAGVALAPPALLERHFRHGSLLRLSQEPFSLGESYYVIAREEDRHRPGAAAVRHWLLEQCAVSVPP